jgi:hypothetical protein
MAGGTDTRNFGRPAAKVQAATQRRDAITAAAIDGGWMAKRLREHTMIMIIAPSFALQSRSADAEIDRSSRRTGLRRQLNGLVRNACI